MIIPLAVSKMPGDDVQIFADIINNGNVSVNIRAIIQINKTLSGVKWSEQIIETLDIGSTLEYNSPLLTIPSGWPSGWPSGSYDVAITVFDNNTGEQLAIGVLKDAFTIGAQKLISVENILVQ